MLKVRSHASGGSRSVSSRMIASGRTSAFSMDWTVSSKRLFWVHLGGQALDRFDVGVELAEGVGELRGVALLLVGLAEHEPDPERQGDGDHSRRDELTRGERPGPDLDGQEVEQGPLGAERHRERERRPPLVVGGQAQAAWLRPPDSRAGPSPRRRAARARVRRAARRRRHRTPRSRRTPASRAAKASRRCRRRARHRRPRGPCG